MMELLNHTLKILHLEDTPTDAELVARELKKVGLDCQIKVVDNALDFSRALDVFAPDIILSDHSLPSFTSLGALKIVQEKKIKVPFILITSTTSEEMAVNVMKAGAWDYILKDRMQRLPVAILQAIEKYQSEQKRIEAEIHSGETQQKIFSLIDNSPLGFIEWNHDFSIKLISKRGEEILGWTKEEIDEKRIKALDLLYDEDRVWVQKRLDDLIGTEAMVASNHLIYRSLAKNGMIWGEWFYSIIKNEQGEIVTFMSLFKDVTEQKKTEQELQQNQFFLEKASEAGKIGYWSAETDMVNGKIRWSNEVLNIFELDAEEFDGKVSTFFQFVHPDDKAAVAECVRAAIEKNQSYAIDHRVVLRNGKVKWVNESAQVVRSDKDKPSLIVGISQDITEVAEYRLSLEEKVEERTAELQEALRHEKQLVELKGRFVSMASHEFRTPLSVISLAAGYIRRFKNKMSPEEIDRKTENIDKQINNMTLLLNDILMMEKGEAGKIEVAWINLPVHLFFDNLVLEVFGSSETVHRVKVKIDYPIEHFRTDEGLMRNIVINLLTNAFKFSRQSDEISLTVSGDKNQMTIAVRDSGIGIPSEDIPKLFKPFHRGGNVAAIQGTGLGLSIIKKAAELLGGEISVQSELGKGTEFTVSLPLV